MEALRGAIKEFLIPGSLLFLVLGLSIGVPLLFAGTRASRWGRRWLAALISLYAILCLQGTSNFLVYGLARPYGSIWTVAQAQGARTIVVLSNGVGGGRTSEQELAVVNLQSAYNALEAARLYRLLGESDVLASGGRPDSLARAPESQALAAALETLGIPHARILQESTSQTTFQQAAHVGERLKGEGRMRFILVTTPEHMRRAVGVFMKQGLDPIPSVSGLVYGGSPVWLPTRSALRGSENAIYEYLAWCFYRLRGWL